MRHKIHVFKNLLNISNSSSLSVLNTSFFCISNFLPSFLLVRQILPTCLIEKNDDSPEAFDKALSDGRPIIVYVHGNSGTRATQHRIRLYKRFQSLGYHAVTFDYRSKYFKIFEQCFRFSRNFNNSNFLMLQQVMETRKLYLRMKLEWCRTQSPSFSG